jgi:hypothetical protein
MNKQLKKKKAMRNQKRKKEEQICISSSSSYYLFIFSIHLRTKMKTMKKKSLTEIFLSSLKVWKAHRRMERIAILIGARKEVLKIKMKSM